MRTRPYMSPSRPNVTTKTALTSRKPISIHSRYAAVAGVRAGRARSPRKIAGSEISTIDALTVARNMPTVVFDSATHL